MLRALIYAYVLGGLTFIPLVILSVLFITAYTSVPVGDANFDKKTREKLEAKHTTDDAEVNEAEEPSSLETNDLPRTRKGWLTMRHTFEESVGDGGYVNLVRSFLDSRSKDPKKSRPKDMWYAVLKAKVLYLYEDEDMVDCGAVVELGSHEIVVYPEGQTDGEMFAKRNAICLKPKGVSVDKAISTPTKDVKTEDDVDVVMDGSNAQEKEREGGKDKSVESEKRRAAGREKELDAPKPWFIFLRSNVEMEDWYLALIHASDNPAQTPTLQPLESVFRPADMNHLVSTLDEQPDVIPMRWFNALIGRVFFSYYRTHTLESCIVGRLMKKLSKVKRPAFLTEVVVTEVSVGNRPPMFSKPMLKELTKEGDASLEVHLQFKGEVRITIEATAIINLGQFKSYTVKLVLAAVLKELEGNLLVKVKRPPSDRIWYAFTQNPRMVLQVEPIVSDRQIKWGMILSTIESKLKEIIQESVVMPNMDDIAFFESSPYRHRGGIWSDASRSEKPMSRPSQPIPEETHSTVSAPPIMSSESSQNSSLPISTEGPPITSELEGEETRPASVIPVVHEQDTPSEEQEYPNLDRTQSESVLLEDQRSRSPNPHPFVQFPADSAPEVRVPDDNSDDFTLDPPSSHSRAPSIRSVKSSKSGKSSEATLELSSTQRKSLEEPRDIPTSPTPSPSSFLSTLKSKAGDKQALSNTARETMRKWGVNWNNLKKEFTSDENGDIASKLRSKIEGNSRRSSNVDVRTATGERRDQERNSGTEEEGVLSRSATPEDGAKNKDRVDGEQEGPVNTPPSSQQTDKRLFDPVLGSKKSVPSVLRANTDVDDISEGEVRPVPIQAQPQAKMMTIPGIHASHKGDVMSMGYVAPQPNPLSDSAKTKNQTMQSVYRLWRNPTAGEGGGIQDSGGSGSVPAEPTAPVVEVPQPQSSSPPPKYARAMPPPLPPRHSWGAASPRPIRQDRTEVLQPTEAAQVKGGDALSGTGGDSLSEVDGATLASINTPPPLPPRRISPAAS